MEAQDLYEVNGGPRVPATDTGGIRTFYRNLAPEDIGRIASYGVAIITSIAGLLNMYREIRDRATTDEQEWTEEIVAWFFIFFKPSSE